MATKNDRLRAYNEKRDFAKTAEPAGDASASDGENLAFVVQKHAARRLHFDFRLEWDGALLSWAVTRGPSADPDQKRLAVRTEDHPLSYRSFEGVIPKGQYGAGTVMLWDTGTWLPLHDVGDGLSQGKLHFLLAGERMRGGWALVRMRSSKKEKRENWLLIKEKDAQVGEDEDALIEEYATSVSTHRTMEEIAAGKTARKRSRKTERDKPVDDRRTAPARRSLPTPGFVKPQLATLDKEVPSGDDWLHETKFDGYRCLAALGSEGTRLFTRSGLDWTDKFGALVGPFDRIACENALIDGEVTAPHSKNSQFSTLQTALKFGTDLNYYAFDLLRLDGKNLEKWPLLKRKEYLEKIIGGNADGAIRLSSHIIGNGERLIDHICRVGGEGIISKKVDAPYAHSRARSWLKIKCTRRQEFVVGGYSPSSKRGMPFASLLVGEYSNGGLRYRGRIGSGYAQDDLEALGERLADLKTNEVPFRQVPGAIRKSAVWVEPRLVVEVDFAEFTNDGQIRHGVFLGLREDKPAKKVTIEETETPMGKSEKIAGVHISSPDRLVFKKAKLTKREVAAYYAKASRRLLSIAGRRPITLFRCPEGIKGECFYQKHAGAGFPDDVRVLKTAANGGDVSAQMVIESGKGFVSAAQMGTIEFHIGGARTDDLKRPDRLVFDLDPDEGVSFQKVKAAADDLHAILDELGLRSVPLLTGGKGIHVCIPIKPEIGWDTAKLFTRTLATAMADREPQRFVAKSSKAKRKNKIYIDWLRNDRAATAIAPWSIRAREGAPVAIPLTWKELKKVSSANVFGVPEALQRLGRPCPYLKNQANPSPFDGAIIQRLEEWIAHE